MADTSMQLAVDSTSSKPSASSTAMHARPTIADMDGENHFAQVARKRWLSASKAPKVEPKVVKQEIWDELERQEFSTQSLALLENLQLLEKYLWPGFSEASSNHHVLLIAMMINVKRREGLPSWGTILQSQILLVHVQHRRERCDTVADLLRFRFF
jgi:intron-binding protein aquarius